MRTLKGLLVEALAQDKFIEVPPSKNFIIATPGDNKIVFTPRGGVYAPEVALIVQALDKEFGPFEKSDNLADKEDPRISGDDRLKGSHIIKIRPTVNFQEVVDFISALVQNM